MPTDSDDGPFDKRKDIEAGGKGKHLNSGGFFLRHEGDLYGETSTSPNGCAAGLMKAERTIACSLGTSGETGR